LFTPNNRAIIRLAGEIKRTDVKSLIIVHGGGSFGHPFAKKYEIAIASGHISPKETLVLTEEATKSGVSVIFTHPDSVLSKRRRRK
jgi:isopentenyl phosphate kinase